MKRLLPNETRVIQISSPPGSFAAMVSGIQTEPRAKAWGERKGYPVVYWIKKLQRAYGVKGGGGLAY